MPLIPDDFQSGTELRPGPGAGEDANASPEAFGAGIAQNLGYAGEVAAKIHYDAVDAANKVAVNNGLNQIDAAGQKALRDPQTGLLYQQTGAQAPAAAQKTLSDLQQQVGKVRSTLTPQQQQDFDISSRHITDQWGAHSDAYVGQQLEEHTKNVATQTFSLADQAISNNPDDAAARIAAVNASVETTAKALHYAPGSDDYNLFVQQHQQAAQTQLGKTAVQAYIAQNRPGDASRYLQENGAGMEGSVRQSLQEQVKNAGTEQQGQAVAMDFLQGTKIAGSGGLYSKTQFNAQVDADPRLQADAKLRESVVRSGYAIMEQHQQAVNEDHNQTFQKLFNGLNDTGGVFTPDAAAAKGTLPPEYQKSLESRSDELLKPGLRAQAQAGEDQGDFAYGNFFQRAIEHPEFLRNMTAAQLYSGYHDIFSDKQYEHALDMLGKAHKPNPFSEDDAPGSAVSPLAGSNTDAYQLGKTAGLDPETMGRFAPAAAAALDAALDANKNVPLTDKQKQDVVGPLLVKSVFVPNPPQGFSPWQDLKSVFVQPGPAGRYVPWPLLTPEERGRLPAALLQRNDAQTREAGAPDPRDVDVFLRSRAGNKQK